MSPDTRRGVIVVLLILVLLVLQATVRVSRVGALPPDAQLWTCGGRIDTLFGHAVRHAEARGLPRYLVAGVAWRESTWRVDAVNDSGAHRAEGLMQIVVHYHRSMKGWTFDPCASLSYGADYLARLMRKYHGAVCMALGEYSGHTVGYCDDVLGYMTRVNRAAG